jgi:hypothetical protein
LANCRIASKLGAIEIDLHQAEGRFFQAPSSDLLQIQTTQSIAWKKKGLLK